MDKANSKLMSQAVYARHRGCSRVSVFRAVQAGRISAFGPDKMIDPDLADVQWAKNTRVRVGTKPPPAEAAPEAAADAGTVSYAEAKRRQAVAEAAMAERASELQAGTMILALQARDAWAKACVSAREVLRSVPDRLAPLLVVETDARAIALLLNEELTRAMALMTGEQTPHDAKESTDEQPA